MTKEEQISLTRLAAKVDHMDENMVTKTLLTAELGSIQTSITAHVDYTSAAAQAETKRIDAILKTNADNLAQSNVEANERQVAADTQAERVANTLRDLVETTRSASSKSLSEVINPIINRLNEIEQKQYENKGKEAVSDPMMTKLIERMEAVVIAMSENKGKGVGANNLWGYIIGGAGLLTILLKVMGVY